MTNTIFDYDDYKSFLKYVIQKGGRGIVKQLSDAAGCQRSYLSQVMNTHINLTSEQIFGISQFLNLPIVEEEYFLLMLEKEKAASVAYKNRIQNKMNFIKQNTESLSEKIKKSTKTVSDKKYYSAWYYSALHIATSMNQLNHVEDFSHYLNLPQQLVKEVLQELAQWSYVKFDKNKWQYHGAKEIHLEDESLLNRLNHSNWRIFSLSTEIKPKQNINYTSIFTISKKDFRLLRNQILQMIDKQRKAISQSGSEELVAFTCDFYKVGEES